MKTFEKLYEEMEDAKVRYVGFTDGHKRFDFAILYTTMFFGKPLIICMQSNRCALLDPVDLENVDYIQSVFKPCEEQEAISIAEFLKTAIPETPFQPQYD